MLKNDTLRNGTSLIGLYGFTSRVFDLFLEKGSTVAFRLCTDLEKSSL